MIMIVVTLAFCLGSVIYTTGYYPGGYSWPGLGSRQNPLPVNVTITYSPSSTTFGLINAYHPTSFDGYTMKVTLLEVIKGDEADKKLAEQGRNPDYWGYDGLMAKFRVEILEDRIKSKVMAMGPSDFKVTDNAGIIYSPDYIFYKPGFSADNLDAGDIVEGWVVIKYYNDQPPALIVFDHSSTDSVGLWFKTAER